MLATMNPSTLTTEMTRDELAEKETIIERGKQTFVEVGGALLAILDGRGYRFEYGTFEEYCDKRWGFPRRTAYNYIEAAELVSNVPTLAQNLPDHSKVLELSKLEPAQVVELVKEVDLDKTSVRQLAQIVKERKNHDHKEARASRIEEITKGNAPLAEELGTFNVIYADPPWLYDYSPTESRAIENQYPTMTLEQICALPVSKIAADDCVLFLWATSPKLEQAFSVINAWGFTYKTCMVWVKDKIGMGYYARQQHELLLIASKGNLPVPEPEQRPSSVLFANRTTHSTKPPEYYDIIECMYPQFSKVELFARTPRPGWKVWGNQV